MHACMYTYAQTPVRDVSECVCVCVCGFGSVAKLPKKKRCRHAAVPNFSEFDRCLLYSVYGPKGISDESWMQCSIGIQTDSCDPDQIGSSCTELTAKDGLSGPGRRFSFSDVSKLSKLRADIAELSHPMH